MKLGTYNIDGLEGSESAIGMLMEEHSIHVLALQETWTRENDRLPPWISAAVSAPVPTQAIRGFGGVALVISPAIPHSVVRKKRTKQYQYIVARVGDMHIASVYISPLAVKAQVLECLNEIKQSALPPAVLLGDFNARHLDWDEHANFRGSLLKKWSNNANFEIRAPKAPTFTNYNGESTVDLGMFKQCTAEKVRVCGRVLERQQWTFASVVPVVTKCAGANTQENTTG